MEGISLLTKGQDGFIKALVRHGIHVIHLQAVAREGEETHVPRLSAPAWARDLLSRHRSEIWKAIRDMDPLTMAIICTFLYVLS